MRTVDPTKPNKGCSVALGPIIILMSSKRQQDDLFLYGGPYPTFVRLHALVGMMVFSFYMLYPSMMSSVFLNQQIEINVQLKLLSQLYG
jgi:hypothetical protein